MGISPMGQVDWFDFYPVKEKLKASSPSSTLLVDIGGSMGHDVAASRCLDSDDVAPASSRQPAPSPSRALQAAGLVQSFGRQLATCNYDPVWLPN